MEVKRIDTADAEMKQQKVKNVCAYCRVSTNIPHQKGSYESQLEYYENMIRSKAGWNFAGIYADYGKSGTKEKGRTDFMRMLEDCDSGEIDVICTKSISRFARNTVECIKVVRELKKKQIDVYFEKERIHTLSEKKRIAAFHLFICSTGRIREHFLKPEMEHTKEISEWYLHTAQSSIWLLYQ